MSSFLNELRRRNVIRVAGLYLVGAWLMVQVAETLLPIFDTPGWVLKALVLMLALGFVPALVVSWVFELTPQGLRRESAIDPSTRSVDQTARRLDIAVIALLLGIGGLMIWQPQQRGAAPVAAPPTARTVAPTIAAVADKSIAVLPFADFSPGSDQSWFADGLTEEILNALARTPDLLVSARTASFRYKGTTRAIPQIAAELGVAHLLEGSVRSTPQRIRVTAQLIRASDGFHLWSQNYDRDVVDMIEIQEDLARQIAVAMQTSMDPKALADMAQVGTRSVEAYQAYIRGVAETVSQEPSDYIAAYESFEQARKLDPEFAAAHARAAAFWLEQLDPSALRSGLTDVAAEEIAKRFGERIDLAIRHAPGEIDRLGYRALKAARDLRMREAIELHRAFLAQRPGDSETVESLLGLATQTSDQALLSRTLDAIWPQAQLRPEMALPHLNYAHRALDKRKAADEALVLLKRWPDHRGILYQIHRALLWDGRVEQAAEVLARWLALSGDANRRTSIPPARQACAEGRRAEVEAQLDRLPAGDLPQRWHLLMLLGRSAEAVEVLQPLERAGNTYSLAGLLIYPQFDPTPFPSLMRVLEREKIDRPPPLALPFACPPSERAP